ncbi:hypothetical protein ACFLZ7_00470 [Nanoarchaeota archaeon]
MFKGQITTILSFVMLLLAVMVVDAAVGENEGLSLVSVKIDGDTLTDSEIYKTQIDRDEELEVKVKVRHEGNDSLRDVEITAFITGYEYNDDSDARLSDTSEPFDIDVNEDHTEKLTLDLPNNVDKDDYKLRVVVSSRNGAIVVNNYNLRITPERHNIAIRDVEFTPGTEVKAGRGLITQVRIKNYGDRDEEDVKVTVSIPELGLRESDWIDEIESDDAELTEEVYMRLPGCAEGEYQVNIEVDYDDDNGGDSKAYIINVEPSEACSAITPTNTGSTTGQTTGDGSVRITVGSETQTTAKGEGGVIYPITLTNNGKTARTFTIDVEGASDWATVKVSPSNVAMVNAGQTGSVYVYVAANENTDVGEKMFSVNVKSGSETLKQIPFKANVIEPSASGWSGVKKALEVMVVVLIVVLIVVGLVIGYNKMKETGEGEEEVFETEPAGDDVAQTYY